MSETTLREAIKRLADGYERDAATEGHGGELWSTTAATLHALLAEHPATSAEEPAEVAVEEREWVAELARTHRDSYPMGNIHHGTPERPDWGTFCVECVESWPCDVSRLLGLLDRERA